MSKGAAVALGMAAALSLAAAAGRPQTPAASSPEATASAVLHADRPGPVVNKNIYGHFAEHLGRGIYEGIWVGPGSPIPNTRGIRNDVVAALKELHVPVLRWPGGCFADEYHWKDGIGPREKRPSMINTHWGGVVEDNSFGTHEFMDLVEQLGTDAYVTGNVGSGTPQEMMEWVEYMTSDAVSPMANLRRQNGREKPWRLPYFGIANEPWGCGGNMRPEYYADEFRRYDTFVKDYDRSQHVYRIAAGANSDDYRWTEVLVSLAGRRMDGLSFHYYTLPTGNWATKGSATRFGEDLWFSTLQRTLRMEELITKHAAAMDRAQAEAKPGPPAGAGARRIGLAIDEWGAWYDPEPGSRPGFLYQQNSLRDALVAALNFHVFHRHADRVVMANIAQTVNVLQAMILTDKEKMLRTPTYWVFEMFKVHQGGTFLPVDLQSPDYVFGQERIPMVSASATRAASGSAVHLSLANTSPGQGVKLSVKLAGITPKSVAGRVLTASAINACNTFEAPNAVTPAAFTGAAVRGDTLEVMLPAKSVVVLTLQ